ncbi:nitrate- and nitrite sensing domain-containing protein [Streptomyces fodineus]|uniref:sensor histidine kinase n=1 Tax=Streptomyces fodineus TaxID=1904616 RepID=UPI000A57C0CB|nr:nitrate- and nitrite sensing domain-containing protein [Streptomyces fodineus]
MRFRGKSIRRKIVALLLVPLVSLTAVWGFATVLTGREVARMFQVSDVKQDIGYPAEDTVRVLQQERRQTLVYLADPRAADALSALQRTRAATDRAIARIRGNAGEHHVFDGLDVDDNERLTAVLDAFDGLGSLRRSVEQGTVNRAQALDLYNRLVDPCFTLLASLEGIDDVGLDAQYRAMVNVSRARELLSREDALVGSSLVVGRLSRTETRDISDLVAQRSILYDVSLPLLPAAERDRYERLWRDATTAPLRAAEQTVIRTDSGTPRGVTAQSWDSAAASALDELGSLDDHVGDRFQDRTRPVALGVILQAAAAGLLGLIALVFSVVLSVRTGRSLIHDLRQLRLEAHEASGVRLPSVMRRLSAGEQVDVETEVPRLEYDKNEMGEVGQALNTLQRAAVEAAVKQSELRSGVSEVFVNLARRSQVLLHKQLTLLDTMERRTEDTDELADLFRLDHLTTRMRRHAEGLVILSGAAPSRQWRRPVQLMDVVRAAVAEVEDYERIEVRRLPRIAVTGPAVADLTHLVAELLENATVFSPPHTAVQVLGERVANGFTLEIHDRGLGMTAEALLDANLRLAETPEFELSDTDRLGLFVVSRLAQRQNVRVSLQPSPYGGTTAVVFIPDALLSDDIPDTNGLGFRLDRDRPGKGLGQAAGRAAGLSAAPVQLPGLPTSLLDGPVELEAPVDLDAIDDFPGVLGDDDSERGGLFRPRRSRSRADEQTPSPSGDRAAYDEDGGRGPIPLPRRQTPKLVSSHGKPVTDQRSRRDDLDRQSAETDRRDDADRQPSEASRRDDADQRPSTAARRPDTGGLAPLPARRRTTPSRRPAELTDRVDERAPAPTDATTTPPDAPALPRRIRPGSPAGGGTVGTAAGEPTGERFRPGGGPAESAAQRTRGGGAAQPAGEAFPPAGGTGEPLGEGFRGGGGAADAVGEQERSGGGAADPVGEESRSGVAAQPVSEQSGPGGAAQPTDEESRPGGVAQPAGDVVGFGAETAVAGDETARYGGEAARPGGAPARRAEAPPAGDTVLPSRATDAGRSAASEPATGTHTAPATHPPTEPATGPLPRRVRQASLAPQLKQDTPRRAEREAPSADRDAEEVRSRMASLQRGWQRGRQENAADDGTQNGTAQGTTKGDGR